MPQDATTRAVRGGGRIVRVLWESLAECASRAGQVGEAWPRHKWQRDPVGFARKVLGVEPWEKQRVILELVANNPRVAVASGHKIGKSNCAAILALWFYCSFPDARVVLSSTTARQVTQILWREVRKLHARAKVPISGEMHDSAAAGIKSDDFREIVGFTAKEAEAVAGISGENLLYIIDEASGVPDVIFEAIEGNRAGGAKVVLFSNPTRTEGEFYEAFFSKAAFYKTLRVSSEETPTATGKATIPGLATREWIEEKRLEWGESSPLYKIRIKGEHVRQEEGYILSVEDIMQSENRWDSTEGVGRLQIGLDPAGPGDGGDESVFAVRRGQKILALRAYRGASGGDLVAHAVGLASEFRGASEGPALVVVDRDGPIGAEVWGLLRVYVISHDDAGGGAPFEVVPVRASDRAEREALVYDRQRDLLWGNMARWLLEGGAIPCDAKLSRELSEPRWTGSVVGRLKATGKRELRKTLGRSPDRADAVALAVWNCGGQWGGDRGTSHLNPYARDGGPSLGGSVSRSSWDSDD